ncbi:uncharacterized protein [Hyperolius riggenbachi]|uniref:uncharacterized protein isoform X4 n=1 Tax=Hyperolius riggenbachi TaxID=752182 RepID=UPI0035A38DC4
MGYRSLSKLMVNQNSEECVRGYKGPKSLLTKMLWKTECCLLQTRDISWPEFEAGTARKVCFATVPTIYVIYHLLTNERILRRLRLQPAKEIRRECTSLAQTGCNWSTLRTQYRQYRRLRTAAWERSVHMGLEETPDLKS